jgi:Domain of unknown function (DUF4150)
MGDTASNQKRVIATKGTQHVATTKGATDAAIDPSSGARASFMNLVKMPKLYPGTCRTFIAKHRIWTTPHRVGPVSEPPHPPFVKGVCSGTHIQEAKATSYSLDVLAEGNGVVRTNDMTTQNHANTVGYVDGSAISDKAAADEAFLKKQCTITKLTGVNEAEIEAPEGLSFGKKTGARNLGYPGKEQAGVPPYYIEILSGTEVKFEVTRKDITTPTPGPPHCWKQSEHTKWLAKRTGEGATEAKPAQGVDKFTVGSALTKLHIEAVEGWSDASSAKKEATKGGQWSPTTVSRKGNPGPLKTKTDTRVSATAKVDGALTSIDAAIAYFVYKYNPVNVSVEAISCGAARKAEIRVFPKSKVKVEVSLTASVGATNTTEAYMNGGRGQGARAIKAAQKSLAKLRDVADSVKKLAALAQKTVSIDFCVDTKLSFELNYKPCTEEKLGRYGRQYTPAHVGLVWKLSFSSPMLIGFSFRLSMSILNFVAPCLGEAAATGLRRLGIKIDLFFQADLSVPLTFSLGQDEYDYWTSTGVEVAIKPTFFFGIDVAAGIDLVVLGVKIPISLSAAMTISDKPKVLWQLQPKGELKVIGSLTFLKDSWFEKYYEGELESARVTWNGSKIDVLTVS